MDWLSLENPQDMPSPGLLICPARIQTNIDRMIETVGGPEHVGRLRPHVKTHKMARVVQVQRASGIEQFKVATLAEAEMVAEAGANDILIAHQLVGPKVERLKSLMQRFEPTVFSMIVDDAYAADTIISALASAERPARLYIDVDCGMGRTGIGWGDGLGQLRKELEQRADVHFLGLHIYDGHLTEPSVSARQDRWRAVLAQVDAHMDEFGPTPVVGGGSPTFEFWASLTEWQCSPGTSLLWDIGYGTAFPELPFLLAAAVFTRVISKPAPDRLCLDLGHKAIASEMPLEQRVHFASLQDVGWISQSEEHLVVATPNAHEYSIGDGLLGYPRHICPTVAKFDEAYVLRDRRILEDRWPVTAPRR